MNLFETLQILNEKKETSYEEKSKKKGAKSLKGRVKTYSTIRDALSKGYYGQIFSTKSADRLYVISKGKWGRKSGRGKIAKGFTKGSATPEASWPSIKKHSARTMLRHGEASDKLAKKYGSRSIKKSRGLKAT